MAISAQLVKQLRDKTGAGMMDCKKALVESEGDFEKAIEILRKKGASVAAKRAERTASEGIVLTNVAEDNSKGIMVEVNCETDFVAKSDDFIESLPVGCVSMGIFLQGCPVFDFFKETSRVCRERREAGKRSDRKMSSGQQRVMADLYQAVFLSHLLCHSESHPQQSRKWCCDSHHQRGYDTPS